MTSNKRQKDFQHLYKVDPSKLHETCPIELDNKCKNYDYHITLTFSGENRNLVEKINKSLKERGVKTFYDKDYQAQLWGKRLTKEFEEIYSKKSRYVMPVISENYPEKIWTNFEMDIIRREADNRNGDFILPLRIDNTQIFGIPDDVGYIDLKKEGFEKTIDLIIQKLKEDPCINI